MYDECDKTVYARACDDFLVLSAPPGCVRLTLVDRFGRRMWAEAVSDGRAEFARGAFPDGVFSPYGGPYRCRLGPCDDSLAPRRFFLEFTY